MEVVGKVAIVTGAGSGTGRAIARRLAAEGASVLIADVDDVAGTQATELIRKEGRLARFVRSDVRSASDVAKMVEAAERDLGGLDILVNNAGGAPEPHFPEAEPSHWGSTLDLNLRAPMLVLQAALRVMRARGGVVVNIASMAGLGYAPYDFPEYGAAKAGLIRLTSSLGALGDAIGVRVNCLAPDWIGTERALGEFAAMTAAEREATRPPIPMDIVVAAVLRLITDDDLAGRVMVLRQDEPPYLIDPGRRE